MIETNKIKTKEVDNEDSIENLTQSISKSILDMSFQSKENIEVVVRAQLKIFYEKEHTTKLGLIISNLQEKMVKSKKHNNMMTNRAVFWKNKYKKLVTEKELEESYQEIMNLEL